MTPEADRKLELRLVAADAPPDSQVIDDLIRLVRQGLATAPKDVPPVSDAGGYRPPTTEERGSTSAVEAQIKHSIEQASRESQAAVAKRAEVAAQPDGERKLAEESRKAAELVVAAVQRALLRGVRVQVPDDPPPTDGAG